MTALKPLIVFVDVDDTLIRSYGTKRIPIPATIEHLKKLKQEGAELFCWSSGGANYAQRSAQECNAAHLFSGFLPKPHVLIDDLAIHEWRTLLQVHPAECASKQLTDYITELGNN
jgi:hypothetical protein